MNDLVICFELLQRAIERSGEVEGAIGFKGRAREEILNGKKMHGEGEKSLTKRYA